MYLNTASVKKAFNNSTLDAINQNISWFLNLNMPQKQWFVQVFQKKDSFTNLPQASRCADCFYITNVNNSYHIFVAGVDAQAEYDDQVLNQDWISIERNKTYTQLQEFVDDVYKGQCVYGVTATSFDAVQS
jgi:hypothetical protein